MTANVVSDKLREREKAGEETERDAEKRESTTEERHKSTLVETEAVTSDGTGYKIRKKKQYAFKLLSLTAKLIKNDSSRLLNDGAMILYASFGKRKRGE